MNNINAFLLTIYLCVVYCVSVCTESTFWLDFFVEFKFFFSRLTVCQKLFRRYALRTKFIHESIRSKDLVVCDSSAFLLRLFYLSFSSFFFFVVSFIFVLHKSKDLFIETQRVFITSRPGSAANRLPPSDALLVAQVKCLLCCGGSVNLLPSVLV